MNLIAVSQGVLYRAEIGERRDGVDQQWTNFLFSCGVIPILIPNHPKTALEILNRIPLQGILLTGGNDLVDVGGDTPERDDTERLLLAHALERRLPLLGVCRGMQVIQSHFGIKLVQVQGHITPQQWITINGVRTKVNSYHRFGATDTLPPLEAWAVADDGVVKAVRHYNQPICGIMWHPERRLPFEEADLRLVQDLFLKL